MDQPLNDHDVLTDLKPRVRQLEKDRDRQEERLNSFDAAIQRVTIALADTERRMQERFEAGLTMVRDEFKAHVSGIEEHLTKQDGAQEEIKVAIAEGKSKWPQSAVVFVSVASSVLVAVIIAWLRNARL